MKMSDTSEKGLETIICDSLIDDAGYVQGDARDFEREHAIDLVKLAAFVKETQPEAFEALSLGKDTPRRISGDRCRIRNREYGR